MAILLGVSKPDRFADGSVGFGHTGQMSGTSDFPTIDVDAAATKVQEFLVQLERSKSRYDIRRGQFDYLHDPEFMDPNVR